MGAAPSSCTGDCIHMSLISDCCCRWVEAMESVPGLLTKGLSYLLYVESDPEVLPALVDWLMESLDESKAMAQPESAYKVRHLKMGFKLAGAMCSTDSNIALQCLVSFF